MFYVYAEYANLKSRIAKAAKSFTRSESGVTAIEYGLIAALIAVVIIAAVQVVGTNLSTKFQAVATNLQ